MNQQGANLANGNSKDKRESSDFYPTPPDVTVALLDFLNLPTNSLIWEPCCGDGAMSRVMESYGFDVFSTDIRDSGYGYGAIDFLKMQFECDAIITNPPFNLSSEFINQSMKNGSKIVALLFKSQFWHAKKRQKVFDEFPPAWVLPLLWRPDFMNGTRGGSPTMEVCWTVWIEGETDTRYRLLPRPNLQRVEVVEEVHP